VETPTTAPPTAAPAEDVERLIADGRGSEALRILRAWVPIGDGHLADARTRLLYAKALISRGRDVEAMETLTKLEASLPEAEGARVRARRAELAVATGSSAPGKADADAALQEAIRIGHPGALATAWLAVSLARLYVGDLHESAEAARTALSYAHEQPTGEPTEVFALLRLASVLAHLDEFDQAADVFKEAIARGDQADAADGRIHLATVHFHAGDWERADQLLRPMIETSAQRSSVPDWMTGFAFGYSALMAIHRGRLEEAAAVLAVSPAVAAPSPRPIELWAAAMLAEARGELDDAASFADRLLSVTISLGTFMRLRLYGPDLIRMLLAVGDRNTARTVATFLAEVAIRARVPSVTAAAVLCQGMLDDDGEALAVAAALFDECPRPLDAGLAHLAVAQNSTDDAAAEHLDRALGYFHRLEAWRDVRQTEEALRRLGRGTGRRGRRSRPKLGWDSLSDSEREVVRLINLGLRNTEIAAQLRLSVRTVETHVSHILAKLDVRSRTDIAVAASSHVEDDRSG
jgi:DNA-binding CsgD family transcriptional regulator/tetratricopeptide (TPR) repeat protein